MAALLSQPGVFQGQHRIPPGDDDLKAEGIL